MPKNFYRTIFFPLLHAAGAAAYIVTISWFMLVVSDTPIDIGLFGPAIMLMLLVLSAAIMAILFFLKPILLYAEDKKKESLWFLGLTVAWFVFLAAAMFCVLILVPIAKP